jgi:hypothetical protein
LTGQRRLAGFDIVHLLLLLGVAELSFNRLAVPALRPASEAAPPVWHQLLDHVGLFFLYFASTLGVAVIAVHALRLWRRRDLYFPAARLAVVAVGLVFAAMGAMAVAVRTGEPASFAFQTVFALLILAIVIAQASRGGDLGAKIGVVLLAAPLLVHYAGPFAFHFLLGEEARWSDLPERLQSYGQWSLLLAALATPYCFAPRPFARAVVKVAPTAVAMFVGVLGAVVLRQHLDVAMLLAGRGFGFDLATGAPQGVVALDLVALATVTWTMVSCFIAESPARREIGLGIALVVVAGYSFAWPVQYMLGAVGLFTIGDAAARVVDEESDRGEALRPRTPPVADAVWQAYVMAVVAALRGGGGKATTLTARTEAGVSTTHVLTARRGIEVRLRVERIGDSIHSIDIIAGSEAPESQAPAWTLHARPERLLGIGAHPEPPRTAAPAVKTGDAAFDQRFRIRDEAGYTAQLLDEGLRARAAASIDGWLAYWPGKGLRHRIYPGLGAPLDHPIPISELAFRGAGAPMSAERLVGVVDLLAEIAGRVIAVSEEPAPHAAEPEPDPSAS